LKNKSFEGLRQRVLPVIEEIRIKGGRKFDPNVFKKHKWSKFINKPENADLLALWEPIERTSAKNSSKDEEEKSASIELCANTTMASSNDHSPLSSDETSPQGMMETIDSTSNVNDELLEDEFGCVINMAGYLASRDFPQNQEVENSPNFLQAPEYHSPCPFGQESRVERGIGYVGKKVLMEYDDTYKLKVFGQMMDETYIWDF